MRAARQEHRRENGRLPDAEIARLTKMGLLFHQGERYMSLIVAPPQPFSIPLTRTDFAPAVA